MKNDYQIFVGIDVSKGKLDYCLINEADINTPHFGVIGNNAKEINKFISSIKKRNPGDNRVLFVWNTLAFTVCPFVIGYSLTPWPIGRLQHLR